MERITKWDGDVPAYNGRFTGEPPDDMHPAWKAVYRHWRPIDIKLEVLQRLARYEDTGLTPTEITSLKKSVSEHLLELQRAELDRRLIILPVRVGGRLYIPAMSENGPAAIKAVVRSISAHVSQKCTVSFSLRIEDEYGGIYDVYDSRIGKSFFFTSEEAIEKAKEV